MTFKTGVPSIAFDSTGVTLPLESNVLTGVLSDIDQAFGGGVNQKSTTSQGQLAQSFSAIIGDKNDQIAEIVNQINPDVAAGRWQDALGRIYFLDRIPASGTVVTGACNGLVGTVIPAGTIAQDTNGYRYATTGSVTIGSSGSVDAQFQNLENGPIPCGTGALSKIFTAVTGWDSVANASAGALGTYVETRADFEARRRNSVALNAVNSVQSIYANVLAVDNVIDAYVRDNPTSSTVTYGATSYSIIPHSVVVSVAGGASANIAQAIWEKKPLGCDYNGTTTATVTDTSGYELPYPAYTVKWVTPASTPVYFAIQIANNTLMPSNIVGLIKSAVISAFSGSDGGSRARIGSTIYSGRYYSGISATDANVQILSVLMGLSAIGATHTAQSFGIDQLPTLSETNILVTLV
jgi:hypothetical protein